MKIILLGLFFVFQLVSAALPATNTVTTPTRNTFIISGATPTLKFTDTDATGDFSVGVDANALTVLAVSATPHIYFKSNNGATTILDLQADGLHSVAKIVFSDASVMTTAGVGSASSLSSNTDATITGDADTNGTGGVNILTGASNRIAILNGGNVGIGTTTPETLLDVNGNSTWGSGRLTLKSISASDVEFLANYKSSTNLLADTTKGSFGIEFVSDVDSGANVSALNFIYQGNTVGTPSYTKIGSFAVASGGGSYSFGLPSNTSLSVAGTSFLSGNVNVGLNLTVSGVTTMGQANVSAVQFADFTGLTTAGYGARVYRSTNQSIPNNVYTCVLFDAEEYDQNAFHSIVTNTDRLAAPTNGIYSITAQVDWDAQTGGYRDVEIERFRTANSTTYKLAQEHLTAAATSGGDVVMQSPAAIAYMDSGDYVRVCVQHTKGSAINVLGGATAGIGTKTMVAIQRIGN